MPDYKSMYKKIGADAAEAVSVTLPTIKESDFKSTFYRMFFNKEISAEEAIQSRELWLDYVAGSVTSPANIVDDHGNILIEVPALIDSSNVKNDANLFLMADEKERNSNNNPKKAADVYEQQLNDSVKLREVSSNNRDKWVKLYEYFGESLEDENPEESKETDDDFFDELE